MYTQIPVDGSGLSPAQSNLKPFNQLTEDQQRELASKGGKKSVEVKRKKKAVKEIIEAIFSSKAPDNQYVIKLKQQFPDVDIKTIEDLINMVMTRKVISGDVKAYNAIYDRKDGKPKQSVEQETTLKGDVNVKITKEQEKIANEYEEKLKQSITRT